MQCWNTTHTKTEIRDKKHTTIIHQTEHNETVIRDQNMKIIDTGLVRNYYLYYIK